MCHADANTKHEPLRVMRMLIPSHADAYTCHADANTKHEPLRVMRMLKPSHADAYTCHADANTKHGPLRVMRVPRRRNNRVTHPLPLTSLPCFPRTCTCSTCHRLLRQYSYVCTSQASKLSTLIACPIRGTRCSAGNDLIYGSSSISAAPSSAVKG